MKKITSLAVLLITFLFLTSYAESVTDNLPKEFFDNADLYAKLEMIENLSIIEKVSAHDLHVAAQPTDAGSSSSEVKP